MDSKSPDEGECVRIAPFWFESKELGGGVLDQIDRGERVDGGVLERW